MRRGKISSNCRILDKTIVWKRSSAGAGAVDEGPSEGVGLAPGDVVLLRLEWHGDAYPGCFFQLQPRTEYLRRPISLCGSGPGYIELAIRVSGEGTREIASRPIGDTVECFGPLGRGFELPNRSGGVGTGASSRPLGGGDSEALSDSLGAEDTDPRFLIIGGGIGVAPLLPLVESLSGAEIDFVVGFKDSPYFTDLATHICSEDEHCDFGFCTGRTVGGRAVETHVGMVLPVAENLLKSREREAQPYLDVFICGPKKMLDALANLCANYGYDPQLLTEAHMACGVGACLGCTVPVKSEGRYARVCADGPMFRASELFTDGSAPPETVCGCGAIARKNEAASHEAESQAISSRGTCPTDECGRQFAASVRGNDTCMRPSGDDPLAVDLGRLHLKSLLTMASGTFGFGREYDAFFDVGILGGVSVKGLTLNPKAGNPGRRVVEVTSGMINSVGLQNPGVGHFLAHEAAFLREKGVAVIANINGESVGDMVEMAELVDPQVDAVELNISCPNVSAGGMSFGTDPRMTAEIVRAVRKVTTKPLIVKLTPNVTSIVEIAKACEAEGAEILSMINTVTGLAVDANTGVKPLARGFGGMSGAAVKPIALRCIDAVANAVNLPILGMGGISSARDVLEFLQVGAKAVAIGTAIFRDPLLPVKIDRDLRSHFEARGKKER